MLFDEKSNNLELLSDKSGQEESSFTSEFVTVRRSKVERDSADL